MSLLTYSTYLHNPSVLYFESFIEPSTHTIVHTQNNTHIPTQPHNKPNRLTYFHGTKVHKYNCVTNTLLHTGFKKLAKPNTDLSLFWNAQESPEYISTFSPFTKFNHLPSSWHLGRKDLLVSHLQAFARKHRSEFAFFPPSFVLPADAGALENCAPHDLLIYKPANASCGRGIKVVDSPKKIKSLKKPAVVQRYLEDPLLINKRKFDLRIYVLVTSLDPLKVYVYEEGLVRLATEEYTLARKSLSNTCVHLTNYSVNKQSKLYVQNTDRRSSNDSTASHVSVDESNSLAQGSEHASNEAGSSKLSLTDLRKIVGTDKFEILFSDIKSLAVKTVISAESAMIGPLHRATNHANCQSNGIFPYSNCFELYGFDILVDSRLKPWLLEVNVSPSLSSSSPFDRRVKTGLVADTLHLVGLVAAPGAPLPAPTKKNVLAFRNPGTRDFDEFDWRLVTTTLDEWGRRGKWQIAFPTAENVGSLGALLETKRYSNEVLARWLSAPDHKFLNKRIK